MSEFQKEVLQDLQQLKDWEFRIPQRAFELAKGDLSEYENMGVSKCSDLLITLALNEG
jgi:hypothetical protein